MTKSIVDCLGLPCPEPVIKTKTIIETKHPAQLRVLVDNIPASENIGRLLRHYGYTPTVQQLGNTWMIDGSLSGQLTEVLPTTSSLPHTSQERSLDEQHVLVIISSPFFGQGDDSLGAKLMENFLKTLPEFGSTLWRIILLNGGVHLCAHPGAALEALKQLEQAGTDILVCGTCLEFFTLTDKKQVGQSTNMLDVVTSMQFADKIIRI